MSKERS